MWQNDSDDTYLRYPFYIDGTSIKTDGDTLTGITPATFYAEANERPHDLLDGFDLWQNDSDDTYLRYPFYIDGTSIKTDGDTITGYTWVARCPSSGTNTSKWMNNAESVLNVSDDPINPNLKIADLPQLFMYDASGNVKDVGYDDMDYLIYKDDPKYITFINAEEYKKRNKTTYYPPLTTVEAVKAFRFTKNCFNLEATTTLTETTPLCGGE